MTLHALSLSLDTRVLGFTIPAFRFAVHKSLITALDSATFSLSQLVFVEKNHCLQTFIKDRNSLRIRKKTTVMATEKSTW